VEAVCSGPCCPERPGRSRRGGPGWSQSPSPRLPRQCPIVSHPVRPPPPAQTAHLLDAAVAPRGEASSGTGPGWQFSRRGGLTAPLCLQRCSSFSTSQAPSRRTRVRRRCPLARCCACGFSSTTVWSTITSTVARSVRCARERAEWAQREVGSCPSVPRPRPHRAPAPDPREALRSVRCAAERAQAPPPSSPPAPRRIPA
jgi:hypothetical protein